MTEVCIRLHWQELGSVTLEAGKLRFPTPPPTPGIYRFSSPEGKAVSYIGQTDGLARRFGHYRNPGPSQPTNIRLNALMKGVLTSGGMIRVTVAVEGDLTVAGRPDRLDFTNKAHRLLAEEAALVAAGAEGVLLDNL